MTPLFCGSECAHEIVCGCSASKTLLAVKFSAQLTGTTRYDKFGKHTCNRSFTSTEQYATIYVMEEFSLLTSDEEPSTRGEANDPWEELSLISEDEEFLIITDILLFVVGWPVRGSRQGRVEQSTTDSRGRKHDSYSGHYSLA